MPVPYGAPTLWRRTAACNAVPVDLRARLIWFEGKPRRMDSMEVNKGIAAILVAGIVFFLTGLIGDSLVRERLPEKPVLNIATAPAATGGGEAKPAGPAPIAPLLASADPKAGDQFAQAASASPVTPSIRAASRVSVRISTASSPARMTMSRGSTIRRLCKSSRDSPGPTMS